MRGKWDLTKEENEKWLKIAKRQTAEFIAGTARIVDLTTEDITPSQVHSILEQIDWEYYKTEKGYEADFWFYYRKPSHYDLVVYTSALTFELAVYYAKDMNKLDFKDEHRRRMMG